MKLVVLYDCTHTAHCAANTGIQRVVRRLFDALAESARPVVFDPYAGVWREVAACEQSLLDFSPGKKPGEKRGAVWSLRQLLRGRLARLGFPFAGVPAARGVILPEVFGAPRDARAIRDLRKSGPVLAIFYDLIPLQLPGLTPPGTVDEFHRYLRALESVDVIAAISEASRDALLDHWKNSGVRNHPPVVAVPLGCDRVPGTYELPPENSPVRVLCVGSIEGRKNHLALLRAAETLWREGLSFELEIIGLAHASTGAAAVALADELARAGRPLHRRGAVSDAGLEAAYAACHYTVYPSLLEGFGLPVIESLARGRPCVCSGLNAMRETAAGGGCELTGEPTEHAVAAAMRRLITDRARLESLAGEARARQWRGWADYSADVLRYLDTPRSGSGA